MLLTTLGNIQYLGRQGLAFRKNSEERHFDQLMKLSATIDPRISKWQERKRNKHVHEEMKMKSLESQHLFYSTTSLRTSTKVVIVSS